MHRTLAIVERELRRFRRSPMLIVMSMIFPLLQLVVLGYAFGGNVKHLRLATGMTRCTVTGVLKAPTSEFTVAASVADTKVSVLSEMSATRGC